jgi:hypothetical protein
VLPAAPRTREQFQWLAAEIAELGGEVSLFTSQAVLSRQQESLEEQFEAPVRAAYGEILAALKRRNPDLAALSKRYQQVQVQDHFQCPLASKVRQRLLSAQEDQ